MIEQSETIGTLAAALAKTQANLRSVNKDKTAKIPTKSGGSYSYRYADLGSIWDACREPLSTNGLAIVQIPEQADAGSIALRTTLIHESGEWISGSVALRLADVTPQALGSALTYLRRYALASIVGIVADEDDDGQSVAGQPAQRQPQQRQAPPPQANGHAEEPIKRVMGSPSNEMQTKRRYFAELRNQAVREKVTFNPKKSPADMSALELDAAISQLEALLGAPVDDAQFPIGDDATKD